MLGLDPKKHLPKEGFDVREVQGVKFRCLPATDKGRRSTHRVQLWCPVCEYWLPFGRYIQHSKGRQHVEGKARKEA